MRKTVTNFSCLTLSKIENLVCNIFGSSNKEEAFLDLLMKSLGNSLISMFLKYQRVVGQNQTMVKGQGTDIFVVTFQRLS